MDTLISLGVGAAYLWSVYALFFGTAGQPGMHMGFTLPATSAGAGDIYLEVASGVTVLILLGRYFEARAKRRAGAALRALTVAGCQGRRGPAGERRGTDPGGSARGRGPVRGPAG